MSTELGGTTEIFKMPTCDHTVPDLMAKNQPAWPTLTIVKGPQTGQTFELNSAVITLGRDPKNSVFLNDMTVSRLHATIDISNYRSGVVVIEDLGSLNGTWVDGAIVEKAPIKDGSTIQIGTFRMVYHSTVSA